MLNTSHLNRTPARRLIAALAPAALLACTGGVAGAQVESERSVETEMSVPGMSPTKSQQITIERNGQVSELKIENGKIVSARHGGKEWPRDRVRESSGSVELLGEDGAVVVRFSMPEVPAAPVAPLPNDASTPGDDDRRVVRRFVSVPPSALTAPTAPAAPTPPTPPPVMLGINMSQPGDALRAHLGLGDRPAILVEGVIDGLPAAKAGLKKHDIIVSIGGSDGASNQMLGETLRNAKPGQTITLKVQRGWKAIDITADLEPYDAERLSTGPMIAVLRGEGEGDGWFGRLEFSDESDLADRARRVAELAARGGVEGAEELQRLAEEIQREASRQVFELRDNRLFLRSREELAARQEQLEALMQQSREQMQGRVEEAHARMQEARPQIQESMDERLKQIESRMDSIEKSLDARLDRLSNMLDRLADRLEREAGE